MAKPPKRKISKARQGRKYLFEVSIVAWVDLLGYGAMLRDAAFNPSDLRAVAAVDRIRTFHAILARHAHRHFPILPLNDGGAAFRDLSHRGASVGCDFLQRALALFEDINETESASTLPGARMVVAIGARVRGPHNQGLNLGKRSNILHATAPRPELNDNDFGSPVSDPSVGLPYSAFCDGPDG